MVQVYDHETMCEDRTKQNSVVEAGETIENRKSCWFLSLFFFLLKTNFPQLFDGEKIFF